MQIIKTNWSVIGG